jgi:hypothetical protein
MFARAFAKYEQAIVIAGCALTSAATLGWMTIDIHTREKKEIVAKYEDRINLLEQENKGLKKLIEARLIQF